MASTLTPIHVTVDLPVSGMARHLVRRQAELVWADRAADGRNVSRSLSATVKRVGATADGAVNAYALVLGCTPARLWTMLGDALDAAGPVPEEHTAYGKGAWFDAATEVLTRSMINRLSES